MDSTQRIHEKILDFLIKENKQNPNFYFATRQRNNDGRLDKGYWFQGENYVYVSFWEGGDWKEKIRSIGFVVTNNKESWLELSAQDSIDKANFFEYVAKKLNLTKYEKKNKWSKKFEGINYLENLKLFLQNEKLEIDRLIEEYKPNDISIIQKEDFKKYQRIIDRRLSQINFGKTNKIARLCWNTNGWKYPSGDNRLKQKPKSYVEEYGFGHEEWLFDKSKIIGGYHYAFIQAFNLETDKHVGNSYNVKLYTIDPVANTKYYVGYINNLECISENESEKIYKIYEGNGWISEMKQQVKYKGGKWSPDANNAQILFNVRFKFNEAVLFGEDEYEIIAKEDINITADYFVLLSQKTEISVEYLESYESDDENESNGNLKNTNKRRRTINHESIYDPYHDVMQNALYTYLDNQKDIYKCVKIEKDRVDLKAKTIEGDWHYFELKTDNAKLSIRKAIGQIMEYAYFPNKKRASKLIIVSDSQPTDRDVDYLKYIRENFNIPVFYRYIQMVK